MSAGFAFVRAASQPIMSGVRDFGIAANLERSAETACHHFTLAFGPVPAPGWRRLSSPVFSPGTGSPLAVVEPVEAQPLNPKMTSANKANLHKYFIASNPPRPFRCHKSQSWRNLRARDS